MDRGLVRRVEWSEGKLSGGNVPGETRAREGLFQLNLDLNPNLGLFQLDPI